MFFCLCANNTRRKSSTYQEMRWCRWPHAVLFGCWWSHQCQTETHPAPVATTWTTPWWHHHLAAETLPRCFLSGVIQIWENCFTNTAHDENKTKVHTGWNSGHTEVKSEDDSGLETLWLLKKMAFLSERGTKQKKTEFKLEGKSKQLWSWTVDGSKAQLVTKNSNN